MYFGKESRKSRASTSRGGRSGIILLVLIFCTSFFSRSLGSQNIRLAWDPPKSLTVAGYFLYCGTEDGVYTSKIDIGNNIMTSVSGLQEGRTYHFAVTAYNSAGVESALSNDTSYLTPGWLRLLGVINFGSMGMEFPVAPGHWYEVQASINLKNWTTIGRTGSATSNAWSQFSDSQAGQFPTRYYRLILH
jgi:Fibronectin type III domain